MPESRANLHHPRAWAVRLIIATMAVLVALTATVGMSTAVAGTNLSKIIATTRRNQIAYEDAMREADRKLGGLWRERVVTKKKIKKGTKKLAQVRARRAELSASAKGAKRLLHLALTVERTPDSMGLVSIPAPPPSVLTPEQDVPPTALASGLAVAERLATEGMPVPAVVPAPTRKLRASAAEIAGLRRDLRKQNRSLRKAKAKARRVARHRNERVRHISRIKRQRQTLKVQREAAERALGSYIKSMTRLSKLRAAKHMKVRPGQRGARFIRPSNGAISQGYHSGHDGIDIVRYRGAPIRASAAGVVSYVGWNPWDEGKRAFVVVIGHSTGYETIYGHLRPIRKVRIGQKVKRGQKIGLMGNTGHSTGPHVHWEVLRNWHTINPASVL